MNNAQNIVSRSLRYALRIVLLLFALLILLSGLLYIPAVQTFAAQQCSTILGKELGMQITLDHIRLRLPLKIDLNELTIHDDEEEVLALEKATINLSPLSLFNETISACTIRLDHFRVNTFALIDDLTLKGAGEQFFAHIKQVDFNRSRASIQTLSLANASLFCAIQSTESEEESAETMAWKINVIDTQIEDFTLDLQIDSTCIGTHIQEASMRLANANLQDTTYAAHSFHIKAPRFKYDANTRLPKTPLDHDHIDLTDIEIDLQNTIYTNTDFQTRLAELRAKERSGLQITQAKSLFKYSSRAISIVDCIVETPASNLQIEADIPWAALQKQTKGQDMHIQAQATIDKKDLGLITDSYAEMPHLPSELQASISLYGNMHTLRLDSFQASISETASLSASGFVEQLHEFPPKGGELKLNLMMHNSDFFENILAEETENALVLPDSMSFDSDISFADSLCSVQFFLAENNATVDANLRFQPQDSSYTALLTLDKFALAHFLPQESIQDLNANLRMSGKGLDILSPETWLKMEGEATHFSVHDEVFSGITLEAILQKSTYNIDIKSKDPKLLVDLHCEGEMQEDNASALFIGDINHIDMKDFGFSAKPMSLAFDIFAELQTDRDRTHSADLSVGNWNLKTENGLFHPKMLTFAFQTSPQETSAAIHTGDLVAKMNGNTPVDSIVGKFQDVAREIERQMVQDSTMRLRQLRPLLPDIHLTVDIGRDNLISNYLYIMGLEFQHFESYLHADNQDGLLWKTSTIGLKQDTLHMDSLRTILYEDHEGIVFQAEALRKASKRRPPYRAFLDTHLRKTYADLLVRMLDAKGDTSMLIGVRAERHNENETLFRFTPKVPIFANRPFQMDTNNYVILNKDNDLRAHLRLQGPENATFWLYNEGENQENLVFEANQINLDYLSRTFTMLPKMEGICSANLRYEPTDSSFVALASVSVDTFKYEHKPVGELLFNAVCLPLDHETFQLDMHFLRNQWDFASLFANYKTSEERIDGTLQINQMPMETLNPFIPEGSAVFKGTMDGMLAVRGKSSAPLMDGHLHVDSASVYIPAASSTFTFDNKALTMKKGILSIDNYRLYAKEDNPIVVDGKIDLRNKETASIDLKMTAKNLLLLDAPATKESLVYGRLSVNALASVKGPLTSPKIRGTIDMLGKTNMTYVLQESSLEEQNRLDGLVEFETLTDSIIRYRPKRPPLPLGGSDVLMAIRIDPAVRINVDLYDSHKDELNLKGGGDLSFQYTPAGDMYMSGRYMLHEGMIKYTMPIIGYKKLNIQKGSYVEWISEPLNPTLSITAFEKIRTSARVNSHTRMVDFQAGVSLTNTLNDMNLQFVLTAPNDADMETQLVSMGAEERGKQAVSLLVAKLYLGDSQNMYGDLNMSDAVTAFLASEVSQIAGSAWDDLEVNVGVKTFKDQADSKRTDYSFSFAKRFYNDRLRVSLGGSVSTGAENTNKTNAFIDNISAEYLLREGGNSSVKAFHMRNYKSIFEGDIQETGAGIIFRRTSVRLWDLLKF